MSLKEEPITFSEMIRKTALERGIQGKFRVTLSDGEFSVIHPREIGKDYIVDSFGRTYAISHISSFRDVSDSASHV